MDRDGPRRRERFGRDQSPSGSRHCRPRRRHVLLGTVHRFGSQGSTQPRRSRAQSLQDTRFGSDLICKSPTPPSRAYSLSVESVCAPSKCRSGAGDSGNHGGPIPAVGGMCRPKRTTSRASIWSVQRKVGQSQNDSLGVLKPESNLTVGDLPARSGNWCNPSVRPWLTCTLAD